LIAVTKGSRDRPTKATTAFTLIGSVVLGRERGGADAKLLGVLAAWLPAALLDLPAIISFQGLSPKTSIYFINSIYRIARVQGGRVWAIFGTSGEAERKIRNRVMNRY